MANEAFALSPISARAASSTDADFEAIREAFLETARGRWFLDEYTKRNRNADTAMVLEAVARIENSLAAQKEEHQRQALSEQALREAPPSEPPAAEPLSSELPAAIAAVKVIVAAARESAAQALAAPVFDDALAPARKCARVIREIAWGLRESGADGRICFLLESQVDAINAACDHAAAIGVRDDVLRAFDQAASDIEALSPSAAKPETAAASVATFGAVDLHSAPEAHTDPAPGDIAGEPQMDSLDAELFEAPVTVMEDASPVLELEFPAQEDQPVEMASIAAAPIDEAPPEIAQLEAVQLEAVPEIAPELAVEIMPEAAVIETAAVPTATLETDAIAAAPASLGASLIASGIVAKPVSPRIDLLAPIRRMSQAEKVAFFS
ncbi:hypothetical protein [Afipia clevelandensis]|uniref:Uncharacterized protein n=1 Tax=Afipia clevelandensis ATCC 49720 TaxID=883079 RepID=K8PB56_9BRAD|nr:hypothetical protein [Afipia clevelandensis]EKS35593.1 hypothetical protein HMPREF9696_01805 [Afipia clevelandensis ATCC 49720]